MAATYYSLRAAGGGTRTVALWEPGTTGPTDQQEAAETARLFQGPH